jgi:integrase
MRRSQSALGIDLNPHDLRRTYAARATEADIPLTSISRQLRHQNLATTAKYIGEPPDLGAALLSNRLQFQVPA